MTERDAFSRALSELEGALDNNITRAEQMKKRIREILSDRDAGGAYREIVEAEKPPLIVQLLSESSQTLDEYGARVRRTEALTLHEEGMTMEQIARAFGVTRQRVSALLREARSDPR
jgi:DNA-directed RNA polymerase sigma subunit (sigma70/sigma32)